MVQPAAPVYTDYREKHVTVPRLAPRRRARVGSHHYPAGSPRPWTILWMQYDFNQASIVLDEQLEIDIPAARTVKLKTKPGMDANIRLKKMAGAFIAGQVPMGRARQRRKELTRIKANRREEKKRMMLSTFSRPPLRAGRRSAAGMQDWTSTGRVPSKEVREGQRL